MESCKMKGTGIENVLVVKNIISKEFEATECWWTYSPPAPDATTWRIEQGRSAVKRAGKVPIWLSAWVDSGMLVFLAFGSVHFLSVRDLFLHRLWLLLLQWEHASQLGLVQPSHLPQAVHMSGTTGSLLSKILHTEQRSQPPIFWADICTKSE